MTTDRSDAELVGAAQAGDHAAFGELVARHQRWVLRAAYLLGGGDLAEDCAQDAFVAAWRAIGRFEEGRALRPWLLRIVTNEVRNRQRAWRRRQAVLTRWLDQGQYEPGPASDLLALHDEERQVLCAALAALPERQRLVVAHRYLLVFSEAETAAALGWPLGTVKSATSRALERLRSDPGVAALVEVDR
jgi:RNA polymerase sigma factor (sigma-70 family)